MLVEVTSCKAYDIPLGLNSSTVGGPPPEKLTVKSSHWEMFAAFSIWYEGVNDFWDKHAVFAGEASLISNMSDTEDTLVPEGSFKVAMNWVWEAMGKNVMFTPEEFVA